MNSLGAKCPKPRHRAVSTTPCHWLRIPRVSSPSVSIQRSDRNNQCKNREFYSSQRTCFPLLNSTRSESLELLQDPVPFRLSWTSQVTLRMTREWLVLMQLKPPIWLEGQIITPTCWYKHGNSKTRTKGLCSRMYRSFQAAWAQITIRTTCCTSITSHSMNGGVTCIRNDITDIV